MIRTTLCALLAGSCLAGAALAQDTPARADAAIRDHPILRLDANGDGQISLAEAQEAPASPMALADANGDGTLTREEMIATAVARATEQATRRATATFDRFDEDGNGRIAVEALPQPRGARQDRGARLVRMFERADTDGDGVLSEAEIADLPARGMGRPGARGEGRQGRMGGCGGRG